MLGGKWLARLLPDSADRNTTQRLLLGAGLALQLATFLLTVAHSVTGIGGSPWESAIHGGVAGIYFSISAAIVALRAATERNHRVLWLGAAAGVTLYALAMDLWGFWLEHVADPPYPSICDFIWWASYAIAGATILGAAGNHARRHGSLKIWLDGLIASTATAAVATAFVLAPVVNSARGAHEAVLAELLYPLGDLVVGTLVVGVIGLAGWRLDRRRILLAAAFVLLLGADSGNSIQVAHGAIASNSWIQLIYMGAFTSVALAAWQPVAAAPREAYRLEQVRWSTLMLPSCFAVTAPVILVYDHFSRVPLAAFLLTMVAMMAAMLRLALALRDVLMLRDMQRAALTDELTGLPNRRMFLTQLQQRLELAQGGPGSLTAVMLDLDNFKQLNDTLGHDAGDELLRLTGPRLVRAAGPQSLVARLGGDEFAILLEPDCSQAEAGRMTRAVLDAFNEPLHVYGLALRLTASAGIATYPPDADGRDTLLKCADIAMYEAKRSRHGWEWYSADNDANTRERLEMTGELAEALDGEEIEVAFQAIVDIDTRLIRGAEALVRWRRPDGSLRPPAEFLEAAELAGLSRQLTRRVLKLSLDNLCEWRAAGHIISVSVNTTVADLLDEAFPEEIEAALKSRGLRGEALKIEVTESSIMAHPARVGAILARLRALGVKIALDDFGTGYSSLTHLRELPVDRLKVDRSFVMHMRSEPTDAAIVYATIELAHKLNMKVIAEGVEDEATWQALLELGCDAIQGYVVNMPTEPTGFRQLLETQGSTPAEERDDYIAPVIDGYLADSQSLPTPASTASGGSIS
jgi:diguanylate cyclase (GGDEF)-like protein